MALIRSSNVSTGFGIVLLIVLLVFPSSSRAKVFTVNHTSDVVDANPGDGICDALPPENRCTLRGAIQEANRYPGSDAIVLPAGVFTLSIPGNNEDLAGTGDLDLLEGVSLSGDRYGGTIIQAGEIAGGLGDRVFHVLSPSVSFRQLTIRYGTGDAAGILVDGVSFRLVDVHVKGNQGSGLSGTGNITLVGGSVSNNTGGGMDFSGSSLSLFRFSVSENGGAGIRLLGGTLLLRGSSINQNLGGGIFLREGTLRLSEGTLQGNSSMTPGGGIFAESSAVTILDSLIDGNSSDTAGGGIYHTGALVISDTSLRGNSSLDGGGIFQEGSLIMTGSTVNGNTASGSGGGLFQAGSLYLTGSTVSGNSAAAFGGGVFFGEFPGSGEFKISGSTVTGNRAARGGGIFSSTSNPVYLKNSILAVNEAVDGAPDCHVSAGGKAQSLGSILLGNPEGCFLTAGSGDLIGTQADPLDPLLEPLAFNGGPTQTHLPLAESPVVDLGNPQGCTDHNGNILGIDQRGFNRNVDGGGGVPRCDIGAVEFDSPGITVTPINGLKTFESGGSASFIIVLESRPTSEVRVDFSSSETTQGIPSPVFVLFDGDNWSEPQAVSIVSQDDMVQDGDVVYTIHTNPAVSEDPKYSGVDPPDVEVTSIDNDSAGITVFPTQGLVTSETGSSTVFTVALKTQPTGDVTLTFSVNDLTEGKVDPTSVNFTPDTWNTPEAITVTGEDDFTVDGGIAYKVITDPAMSDDPLYDGKDPDDVFVFNLDNDSPGITISPTTGLITTESGGTDEFTVVLHSRPSAPVSIKFLSTNPDEGTVPPEFETLEIVEEDWNKPHPVTVAGVDDFDLGNPWDGDAEYAIITEPAISEDPDYKGRNPSDVQVVNRDNDVRGITITPLSALITTEFGGKAKISIVLDFPPISEVSLSLESSDPTEGFVEPSGVTFNPDNWNDPRIVEVIGVNDEDFDGDITYTLYIHPAVSGDPYYHQMDPEDLTLVNLERESKAAPNSVDATPDGSGGCGFIQGGGPGGPTLPFFLAAGLALLLFQRFLRYFQKTQTIR